MRFTIVIAIDYDEATITPDHMQRALEQNVDRAIQNGLLDDAKSIVDQYNADVVRGPLDTLTQLHPDLPGKSF